MNDFFENIIQEKAQPMVDFNYDNSPSRNPRKSMFRIFSKKSKSISTSNNNPEDLYNANNKINSILSKNLKSIYKENKDDLSKDTPIFQNVNCLIRRSQDSNKLLYNQYLNLQNNAYNYNKKKSSELTIINNKKMFQKTAIISAKKKLQDTIVRKSVRKTIDIGKKVTFFQDKPKKKVEYFDDVECRTPNNRNSKKKPLFVNFQKRNSSSLNNIKFNLNRPQVNFKTDAIKNKNNRVNRLSKDNGKNTKKRNSVAFLNQNTNGKRKSSCYNERKSVFIVNKKNMNKRGSSIFKNNEKVNNRKRSRRSSLFYDAPAKNMQIPTLKQINNAITKTFIGDKLGNIKKELKDLENTEVVQMIKEHPQTKIDKRKKFTTLANIGLSQITEINNSENKDLLNPTNIQMSSIVIDDDRFQKKYRKLYLSKNLYDSLDDEEVQDQEKIYIFYISPNSIKVYILDFFVLISSLIELYYLPIYISKYISSYSVYNNDISSMIFYIIDFIYIIDLIAGFFRAFYNFEEVLIKRNSRIALNYLTGWFLLDLIEALPFFTLLNKNMKKSINKFNRLYKDNSKYKNMFDFGLNNNYFSLTFLKCFKVFKSFTYNRLFNEIYRYLDKILFFSEWKGLFFSIIVAFSALHFSTCFFIFLGKNEFEGWIVRNSLQDSSFADIYIASLYYQMTTLTTVGYGDISATIGFEKIYGIFILIVGTCAYSWILTYISNYIKKNNEKYIDFQEKIKVLTEIKLEYPNLKKALYDRIKRYLNYNKSKNKYNIKFILESLPSSLQNNLIIEIYKPIIMNFQFFKTFENSDFFVKIVTSLKPILSMKDDILNNEGDIIEDIIFIKNGVLTLEIIIDLNDPKESIEKHLELTGMDYFKNISNHKFTQLMNLNTLNTNYRPDFAKPIYADKSGNKKEIKIIDLRKNEHFGDILMILNEKSPVAVKVKSKKAELFFLQKTEATEISNRYSNIWKRIVNRSLHNMKQIKNLIRKKVFLFIESNNIKLDQEFTEKYLSPHGIKNSLNIRNKAKKIKSNKNINTIIEEEGESNINKNQSTKEQTSVKIIEEKVDTKISKENKSEITKSKIKKVSFKENSTIKINNEKKENIISILDKEVKRSNKNQNNQYNTFNINIYTPKVQFPFNQINIQNKNSNLYNIIGKESEKEEDLNNSINSEKINNEFSYNNDSISDIKNNNILMDNSDENNIIYFSNKIDESNKYINQNKNSNNNLNSINKLIDKRKVDNKQNSEKSENKTNDLTSLKYSSSDKEQIKNKREENIKPFKINKFSDLNTSHSTSFSIESIYENINQISKYKYYSDSELREKTKKFILGQINSDSHTHNSILMSKTVKNNNKFLNIDYNIKSYPKRSLIKNQENIEKSLISNRSKNNNSEKCTNEKRPTLKFEGINLEHEANEYKSDKKININTNEIVVRKDNKEKQKGASKNSLLMINSNSKLSSTLSITKNRSNIKKKHIKKNESVKDKDKTFYNKISRKKTMRIIEENIIEEEHEKEQKKSKMNYDKLISKNIEKNQQNLNNPEEYFEGFFNDIIFKKKQNNKLNPEQKIEVPIDVPI